VSSLPCSQAPPAAEGFLDFYGGWALAGKTDAVHQRLVPPPPPGTVTKHLNFDASGTFGVRGGYWFEPFPWLGFAVDLSFFQRKAEAAHIDLVPLSLLLMLRYPLLTSEQFPKGQLQPYVGIGPSVFSSHTSIDFGPPFGGVNHGNVFGDGGVDVRAGLTWQAHKSFGLFWEYRFTHVNLDYQLETCPGLFTCTGPTTTHSTTDLNLDTHHFLVGIRF